MVTRTRIELVIPPWKGGVLGGLMEASYRQEKMAQEKARRKYTAQEKQARQSHRQAHETERDAARWMEMEQKNPGQFGSSKASPRLMVSSRLPSQKGVSAVCADEDLWYVLNNYGYQPGYVDDGLYGAVSSFPSVLSANFLILCVPLYII
mgnify:CR=1 FL=1